MTECYPVILTEEGAGLELECGCGHIITAHNPRKAWEGFYTHAGRPIPDDLPSDKATKAKWGITPGRRPRR